MMKKCQFCKKRFKIKNRRNANRFCSRKCFYKVWWTEIASKYAYTPKAIEKRAKAVSRALSGRKPSALCIQKAIKANTGRKLTKEHKRKIGDALRGEKNYLWKGESVSYRALHTWVEKRKGKPQKCEMCGTTSKSVTYDWANKSGKYRRDLNDFIRLCKPCHRKFDGKKS